MRVQPGGGFIEHEHLGLEREHTSQRHAPPLAATQLDGHAVLVFLETQFHALHGLAHARAHQLAVQPQLARAKGHIIAHVLLKELRLGELEDQPHAPANCAQVG